MFRQQSRPQVIQPLVHRVHFAVLHQQELSSQVSEQRQNLQIILLPLQGTRLITLPSNRQLRL